jgi:hypothetical protein
MSKHTDGPWKVRVMKADCFVEGNEVVGVIVTGEYRREIMGDENYPKKLADAHLVSAAPDLLEALEGMAMVFSMWEVLPKEARTAAMQKAMQYADAAIDKAKGEEA